MNEDRPGSVDGSRASGERRVTATREDMDRSINSLRRELQTQRDGDQALYLQMFESGKVAVEAALAGQEKAVAKAENAAERRFEGVNEFRAQLGDQQRTLMPRQECEVRLKALESQIETLSNAYIERAGAKAGARDSWAYIVGAIGVLIALLTLALRFSGP